MSKLNITPIDPSSPIFPNLGYCPYMEINAPHGGSYSTLTNGLIAAEQRANDENTAIPPPLPNGGL